MLARLGAHVVAGDLSQVQLNLNRQHADQYGFASTIEEWVQIDICDMPHFASESFDCVVAYGSPLGCVLDQRDIALSECLRVLKPNRLLILSVASLWGSAHRHLDRVLSIPATINQQITTTGDILPGMIKDQEQFFHMFRAAELYEWLETFGVHICKLLEDAQSLMRAAMSQLNLSARANHRTQSVKLARTIADLAGSEEIQSVHLAKALPYRPNLMLAIE